MFIHDNKKLVEGASFPFSENFISVLNSQLASAAFRYAFDFDGVLTIISEERRQLQKMGDGETYSSPEQFIKDGISPVGIMAINLSWSEPIAIITNREASKDKILASFDWLIRHGACMANIFMVMRQEGVSHTKAERKYEVLSQLKIKNFYLDDKESTVIQIQTKCPDVNAYFYSSQESPDVLLEKSLHAMAKASGKAATL
ncbi:hypothetical protein [Ewingella americana]|uniref:Uncharacterized protein n=1 Tax=Ewingella americana TaxID=41202 RepID=A0A502GE53_9GAMM|nr:hypothetical protein [Ewingella americana]TPG60021.1 hypothetical protein EAH77_15755 [Ewingella americana]